MSVAFTIHLQSVDFIEEFTSSYDLYFDGGVIVISFLISSLFVYVSVFGSYVLSLLERT